MADTPGEPSPLEPMTPAEVRRLVTYELAHVADPARREALRTVLVDPAPQERRSEWFDAPFACWVVAAGPWSDQVVVFCERGFASDHWGALPADDGAMGLDSDWFSTLDDAFIASGLWTGDLPADYVVGWMPARRPFAPEPVEDVSLAVADVETTARFYAHVLGMRPAASGGDGCALEAGGRTIHLRPAGGDRPGAAVLRFSTRAPAEEVAAHLRACGVATIDDHARREGDRGSVEPMRFRDPDGNLLEVASLPAEVPEPADGAGKGAP